MKMRHIGLALLGALTILGMACQEPSGAGSDGNGNNGGNGNGNGNAEVDGGSDVTVDAGSDNNNNTPDAGNGGEGEETCDVGMPLAARLLNRQEYNLTVAELLFDQSRPADSLPEENNVLGFDNNAEYHQATPVLVEGYLTVAEELAERVVTERLQYVAPCDFVALGSQTCREVFLAHFGRRAFRRPLTDDESAIFRELFDAVFAASSYHDAIRLTVQAFLQSPQFLYRVELPGEGETEAAQFAVSPYALASRLSYFLWGSMPDEDLLTAAANGTLSTFEGVQGQVSRLLADPRAKESVRHFHRQWLHLNKLDNVAKDGLDDYPGGMPALGADLKESMLAFVDGVFWANGNAVNEMLSSSDLYLNDRLGPQFTDETLSADFQPIAQPATERAGLLTHPSLMSLLAHANQTSPIHRGIFVREKMLCDPLPPPPNDLLIEPPDPDPTATTRDRFAQHTEDPTCQGCHELIDPIGFGFEGYDELGRFRTTENDLPIDVSGSLLYTNDPEIEGDFNGAVELSGMLAQSNQVKECIATQWYRYAFARGEVPAEACRVQEVRDGLTTNGSFTEMLTVIATGDGFRMRSGMPIGTVLPLPDDDGSIPGTDNGLAPVGNLDGIDANGLVTGWALDPDAPASQVVVELYLDGGPGVGLFLLNALANVARADVNALDPAYIGDHGFSVQLPPTALDALDHDLVVVAKNSGMGDDTSLPGSPMAYRAGLNANPPAENNPPANNNMPEGFLDNVSVQGRVSGWALDRDDTARNLEIQFYVDGPAFGGGVYAGTTNTGLPRQDVNDALGVTGAHGWGFDLPATYQDGQMHTVYVYAFNAGHPGNTHLSASPMTFTLTAGGN